METTRLVARLRAAGCVFAEEEAALLIAEARDGAELERMTTARVAGEPLEYILGWAEFRGIRIAVEQGVFVPRQRTGFLVDETLAGLGPGAVVVDLCCGTGAIAAAIAHARPHAVVYAADLDPAAVRCARRNLPYQRVFEGDLFGALPLRLRGSIEALVVNAPYVPTDDIRLMPPEARDHEARVALDGGTDGLDLHRRIAAEASRWLTESGRVLIETSQSQAERTAEIFHGAGLTAVIRQSSQLDATAVAATAPRR